MAISPLVRATVTFNDVDVPNYILYYLAGGGIK